MTKARIELLSFDLIIVISILFVSFVSFVVSN